MAGRLTLNPNGTINFSGRQRSRGVLTSRDLYGVECETCDGSGSLNVLAANGRTVGKTDCPDCDGEGVVQEN